jgi:hypothetical protein
VGIGRGDPLHQAPGGAGSGREWGCREGVRSMFECGGTTGTIVVRQRVGVAVEAGAGDENCFSTWWQASSRQFGFVLLWSVPLLVVFGLQPLANCWETQGRELQQNP